MTTNNTNIYETINALQDIIEKANKYESLVEKYGPDVEAYISDLEASYKAASDELARLTIDISDLDEVPHVPTLEETEQVAYDSLVECYGCLENASVRLDELEEVDANVNEFEANTGMTLLEAYRELEELHANNEGYDEALAELREFTAKWGTLDGVDNDLEELHNFTDEYGMLGDIAEHLDDYNAFVDNYGDLYEVEGKLDDLKAAQEFLDEHDLDDVEETLEKYEDLKERVETFIDDARWII